MNSAFVPFNSVDPGADQDWASRISNDQSPILRKHGATLQYRHVLRRTLVSGVEENFYLIWPTVVHRISPRKLMMVAGKIQEGAIRQVRQRIVWVAVY